MGEAENRAISRGREGSKEHGLSGFNGARIDFWGAKRLTGIREGEISGWDSQETLNRESKKEKQIGVHMSKGNKVEIEGGRAILLEERKRG